MANGTCSESGTISYTVCVRCCNRIPRSVRALLMSNSPLKNLPMFCFRLCCLLCCGRTTTPPLCWRSCAGPYIDRIFFPHCCGNFIASKLNTVHSKGMLIGKLIAVSCCCLPALCGTLPASISCALDAAMPNKPLMTVKTRTTLQKMQCYNKFDVSTRSNQLCKQS